MSRRVASGRGLKRPSEEEVIARKRRIEVWKMEDAVRWGREVTPLYGRDASTDECRYAHLNPDELLNLYRERINARRERPIAENAESIDIGIGLLTSDIYAKNVHDAKKQIAKIAKEEAEKLARGEIRELSLLGKKHFWSNMFRTAQTMKDTAQLRLAIDAYLAAENDADMSKLFAGMAEREHETAKKSEAKALAKVENAKKAEAAYEAKNGKNPKLHQAVIKAEEKALKEMQAAEKTAQLVASRASKAKTYIEGQDAALDFAKEIWKDIKDDMNALKPYR